MIIIYKNRMYKVTKMCGGRVWQTYNNGKPNRSLDKGSKIAIHIKKQAIEKGFVPFYYDL